MFHLPSIPALPSPRPHPQDIRWDRRLPGRLLVATVALALAACEFANPVEHRDVAIVAHMDFSDPWDPRPEIPETATAGVPLEIAFWTRGGGCVRRIDRTEVVRGRESAVVTPYDVLAVSPICTDDIRFLVHSASVVFDEPGTATVVLRYSTTADPREDRIADGQREYTVEVSRAGTVTPIG